jgi:hypothetical protein
MITDEQIDIEHQRKLDKIEQWGEIVRAALDHFMLTAVKLAVVIWMVAWLVKFVASKV